MPILISSSPVKDDNNYWLVKLKLTFKDKLILQSSDAWLNDSIIYAAQCLLRDQSIGRIYGWKSTQCAKRAGEKFPSLPPDCAFVQILHVGGNHWITTSNVDPLVQNAHYRDAVAIYDSIFTLRVRASTKQTICQFLAKL